jgi:rare lipoprotein A (peptidoglycan hydrolase)
VVINDRGPFGGRIIDLSSAAFARIAPLGQGVAHVRISW